MPTKMSQAEKEAFLADLHVGVLSLGRSEMGPLTVPIWYDYEPGATLWFLTGPGSRKGRLLEVGTRLSLCAQSEMVPYKYVSIEGVVISMDEPDGEGLPMAIRYLGEEMGKVYSESSDQAQSVLVRVQPEHWLAVDYGKIT